MDINQHSNLSQLLNAMSTKGMLFEEHASITAEEALKAPCALAAQIAKHCPELLDKESASLVVIDHKQTGECFDAYHLLNALLGTNINFRIVLMQDSDVCSEDDAIKLNKAYQDKRVHIQAGKLELEDMDFLQMQPDAILINETEADQSERDWLDGNNFTLSTSRVRFKIELDQALKDSIDDSILYIPQGQNEVEA